MEAWGAATLGVLGGNYRSAITGVCVRARGGSDAACLVMRLWPTYVELAEAFFNSCVLQTIGACSAEKRRCILAAFVCMDVPKHKSCRLEFGGATELEFLVQWLRCLVCWACSRLLAASLVRLHQPLVLLRLPEPRATALAHNGLCQI